MTSDLTPYRTTPSSSPWYAWMNLPRGNREMGKRSLEKQWHRVKFIEKWREVINFTRKAKKNEGLLWTTSGLVLLRADIDYGTLQCNHAELLGSRVSRTWFYVN